VAFPTIPTSGNGRLIYVGQRNNSSNRLFPAFGGALTFSAGDLLIAIIVAYQGATTANATFGTWTAGWTEFMDSSTSATMAIGGAYKWATGSEANVQCTQAATVTGEAVLFVMSIPGAHPTTPPEFGGRSSTTSTVPDPTTMTPSWGADDTLWIGVGGSGETATTGSWTGITGGPANYSTLEGPAPTTDVLGSVDAYVCFRQLNAASEDVGTWTTDTSNARAAALTVAVRPAPAAAPLSGSWGESWS
jgi:hypothetical protein